MRQTIAWGNVRTTRKHSKESVIHESLQEYARDAVRPALVGLTALYVIFAISHLVILPGAVAPFMAALALVTAVMLAATYVVMMRWHAADRWINPIVYTSVCLLLINTLVHMYLLQDVYQSTNVALIIIGAGIVLLSARWLLAAIATALGSWLLVSLALSTSIPFTEVVHFGYLLLIATVLSVVSYFGRSRAYWRIVRMRRTEAQRQREVEQALLAVQQSEEQLQQAHADLELHVSRQTIALEHANAELLHEVTERRQAEADTQFLATASAQMTGSLEFAPTLESVARHAVPYLADYCVIDLLENQRLYPAAVMHVVPEKGQLVYELRECIPYNDQRVFDIAKVLKAGRSELVSHLSEDHWSDIASGDPECARVLGLLQPYSYMIVPLVVGNSALGTITFVASESRRTYDQRHLHIATDLAQRAALALEHARLYQKANTAIAARDAFVSIAAHELKSPLTALKGYAQLLHDRAGKNPDGDAFQRRALQTMLTQSKRIDQLISTMLDVSRIDNDQLALNLDRVDMEALVRMVVDDVRMYLDMHRLELIVDTTTPPIVWGDALRLEQAVQNLLQNAIKYSPNGGTVTVRLSREHERVVVAITDTGIGIAHDDIPRLFQRFYRAASAEHSNIRGMGIGLYVVREILLRHGGTIDVESAEWESSTFQMRLPLLPELQDATPPASPSSLPTA